MFFQVLPLSVDFQMPSPQEMLWRLLPSPVPSQTRLGLRWDMATAPTDIRPLCWNSGVKVAPPSVVIQRPPWAEATKKWAGLASSAVKSVMRPDMEAGPMERKWRLWNCWATGTGAAASWTSWAGAAGARNAAVKSVAACAAEGNGMVPAIGREPCPAEAIAMPGGAGLRGGVVTACDAVGHGGLSPLPRGLPYAARLLRISVSQFGGALQYGTRNKVSLLQVKCRGIRPGGCTDRAGCAVGAGDRLTAGPDAASR